VAGYIESPYSFKYFTSTDGSSSTFKEETLPKDLEQSEFPEQTQFGDLTLVNAKSINLNGGLIIRYSDGTMKRVTYEDTSHTTFDSMNAKRFDDQVIVYIKAAGGKTAKITIPDVYNPESTIQWFSVDPNAIEAKWGESDVEKLYVASNDHYFYTLDSSGNILSEESYEQWGLGTMYSIRLVGDNMMLVGGQYNNIPVLALRGPQHQE